MTDPTIHQSYLAFPKLDAPMVNENRTVATTWERFFEGVFLRLGQGMVAAPNSALIQQSPVGSGAPLSVYSSATGVLLGVIFLQNTGGGPAEPLAPPGSPFTFATAIDGNLIVSSGKLEISRDLGGTWELVSLVGGALPMLKDDQARISWTHSVPTVTYLPIMFT